MIQAIVTPSQKQFDMSVVLPNNYIGKQVHVLFYTDDEIKNSTAIISKQTEIKKTKKLSVANIIKKGFEEMQLIKQGKLKTTPLHEFLNEL